MRITVIGSGYVGLVTGACLAEVGNHVLCVDNDARKVGMLEDGRVPIFEPGLDTLVRENAARGRLRFTTDLARGVDHGRVLFIAVGTPPEEDGSADLQHVLGVAAGIGEHLEEHRLVVTKSTVPVGTADRVRRRLEEVLEGRGVERSFDVVSNPEFLKEGAAIEDFMKPDRIVIGAADDDALEVMREIYAPFSRNHDKIIAMDVRSAELTKYAANALLATKISFMNEMANLAERLDADIECVRRGIGADPRIGYHFIYPGCGYGGSCFPKDVKALHHAASQTGFDARVLAAVEAVNAEQKRLLVRKVKARFGAGLAGRRFALWGLSFKPNTDDMREAPSRVVMEELWDLGATVSAFDPVAGDETRKLYGERPDLALEQDQYAVLDGADALIVCTEWSMFRSPDFDMMAARMRERVIFDGRNIFDPVNVAGAGFEYHGIGRRTVSAA